MTTPAPETNLGELLVELETETLALPDVEGQERVHTEARIRELMAAIPAHLGAFGEYVQQIERDLRELRNEGVTAARTITRLTETNDGLNAALHTAHQRIVTLEFERADLNERVSRILGEVSETYRILNALPLAAPTTTTTPDRPRLVAEGR